MELIAWVVVPIQTKTAPPGGGWIWGLPLSSARCRSTTGRIAAVRILEIIMIIMRIIIM